MLHALFQLAAETSSEARARLLHAVTDLFFYDPDPTVTSKHHYGEIALGSLPHLDTSDRLTYADKVASQPNLPRGIANALAGDCDSDVARLVLRLSPVLTDNDLAAIALNQSQEHLTAIAERARLSESVTDILVERGDNGVLKTVGGNEGAAFSETGFNRLLERGRAEPEIHRAVAIRSDLTQDRAERVMRLLAELGEGRDPDFDPANEAASIARQARRQRLEVTQLMTDLAQKTRALDDVLVMLAQENRAFHLAQVLARVSGIAMEETLRALLRRDVGNIVLVCRALDVGYPAFAAILELRARRLMFSTKHVEDGLSQYSKIDMTAAERGLTLVRLKAKAR